MDEGQEFMIIAIALILGIALAFSIPMDRQNDKELQKTTSIAYEKCKKTPPTKTYQTGGKNFVVIDGKTYQNGGKNFVVIDRKVYQVTDEDYRLFTVNEKCR